MNIGNTLFPTLGNGGYDALHRSMGLRDPTADPSTTVDGRNAYGVPAADELSSYARETQTLSLHPAFLVTPPSFYEPIIVHELAPPVVRRERRAGALAGRVAQRGPRRLVPAALHGGVLRGNDVFTLFSPNVYEGGSLVLYALRQVVGDQTFQEIERTWVKKYKDQSVSTEQCIAHVNRVSHRNLNSFLRHWLYDSTIPPMPGHPDWTADPVTPTAARSARSAVLPHKGPPVS